MHLLVTRPEPDAGRLKAHLEALGHEATSAPLMHIRIMPEAVPDLNGVQALVFTSANGVRAFATLSERRDVPAFAVGPATAEAARRAGFADVRVAGGDVDALAARIGADLGPGAGPVFHAAGRHVAGDLAQALAHAGIEVRRQVLYEAEAVSELPAEALRALNGTPSPLQGVLFFSPRSAKLFEDLVARAGLSSSLESVTAYCLSAAVAKSLSAAQWAEIAVAVVADQTSLLALLPTPVQPSSSQQPPSDR